MNDNRDIDALTVRYLQGTCTAEERAQFFSWLSENGENETSFHEMKEIFDTRRRKPAATLRIRPWIRPMRYAAMVAVVFGASLVFYLRQKDNPVVYVTQTVIHNTRGVYQVTLPDGSRVWLHGGTTLAYPDHFSDSLRVVDLQGEAYFAVHADAAHPFVVRTPTAKVRATGTEFNITAYPGDKTTTTTLVKGIVDIQPNHLTTSIELKPDQQAVVSAGDVAVHVSGVNNGREAATAQTGTAAGQSAAPVVVHNINADLYTDWKDGVYRFKNEPFQNIVLRLEKMYGVNIRIENDDLKKTSFSGMFTTDFSLKEVFEIIDISNPISYRIQDKVVYIGNRKN